ncbi:hypothetical protein AVEN_174233-1 [Araneus ventricosus]|uniref:Uncharacterized protein n=1 Tax=Araneus ventricosus TaxID=182803 RepID=A0A4Y2XAU6_ARAVE|nr:hypothetical protein AVEN_174233-1 [Araneus ventricosus]
MRGSNFVWKSSFNPRRHNAMKTATTKLHSHASQPYKRSTGKHNRRISVNAAVRGLYENENTKQESTLHKYHSTQHAPGGFIRKKQGKPQRTRWSQEQSAMVTHDNIRSKQQRRSATATLTPKSKQARMPA